MASQQRELPTAVAPIPRSSPRRSEWNSATHSINNAFTHLDLLMADCVLNLARFFLLSLSRRFQLSPNSFHSHLSQTPLHLSWFSLFKAPLLRAGEWHLWYCEVTGQTAQDRVMWLNPTAWPSAVHWYIPKSEHLGYSIIDLLVNLGDRKWQRFCVCLWVCVCVCMGGVRLENMLQWWAKSGY